MNSIKIHSVKAEKARNHRQLKRITNLFRFVEVFIVSAVLFSWASNQLPTALKHSTAYFHNFSVILISPRFVFVVGNVIVITLFAKAGQFSSSDQSYKFSTSKLYDEIVKKNEKKQRKISRESSSEEMVNPDPPMKEKNFGRTKSENLRKEKTQKARNQLRLSETQIFEKSEEISGRNTEEKTEVFPEDGLSNEEFNSKVEAFIARQQMFRIEEEFSAVFV